MANVKVTKQSNVPLSGSETRLVQVGEVVEIGDVCYYPAKTASGNLWLPADIFTHVDTASSFARSALETGGHALAANSIIDIRTHQDDCFKGDPLQVDTDFLDHVKLLGSWARELELAIFVTSSLRRKDARVSGAIVPRASRSNHLVGHAIDMNLIHGGRFFNSQKLKKGGHGLLPGAIRQFIDNIRKHPFLRWGGDFATPDPVHIDDNLSRRDPGQWEEKFIALYSE